MKQRIIRSRQEGDRTESHLYSWELEELTIPQKYFHLAKAYVDSSITLFRTILTDSQHATFSHAQAAALLLEQGLELFLKGASRQAGHNPGNTHDLGRLYKQFTSLYPGKKYAFEARIKALVRDFPHRPHMEWTRYPVDQKGNLWQGNTDFVLELWMDQVQTFRRDFERLIPLIESRKRNSEQRL